MRVSLLSFKDWFNPGEGPPCLGRRFAGGGSSPARDFEKAVTEEEDSGSESELLARHGQLLVHRQRGESDIDAVHERVGMEASGHARWFERLLAEQSSGIAVDLAQATT